MTFWRFVVYKKSVDIPSQTQFLSQRALFLVRTLSKVQLTCNFSGSSYRGLWCELEEVWYRRRTSYHGIPRKVHVEWRWQQVRGRRGGRSWRRGSVGGGAGLDGRRGVIGAGRLTSTELGPVKQFRFQSYLTTRAVSTLTTSHHITNAPRKLNYHSPWSISSIQLFYYSTCPFLSPSYQSANFKQ